jgi:hypothetical protein
MDLPTMLQQLQNPDQVARSSAEAMLNTVNETLRDYPPTKFFFQDKNPLKKIATFEMTPMSLVLAFSVLTKKNAFIASLACLVVAWCGGSG